MAELTTLKDISGNLSFTDKFFHVVVIDSWDSFIFTHQVAAAVGHHDVTQRINMRV